MGIRICLAVVHLGCWLLAQGEPTEGAALPDDLRAALLAMPRQESPATGLVVTVIDGETKAALPDASVFVIEPAKLQAVASRIPRGGPDLEREMLALPWLAGRRYQTGGDGKVVVPKVEGSQVIVVTTTGLGIGSAGRPDRRTQAPVADAVEVRVETHRDYVVRAVSTKGQPVVGVPIELGLYGDNGMDRFEAMRAYPTDARGQVRFRMPGIMARSFSGPKGTLSAQVSVLGGPAVRRVMSDAGKDGVLELVLPPLGKVIVRLYDAQEQPRSGLKSVHLQPANAAPRRGPLLPMPGADRPQELTAAAARFDFVALGQKLVARVGAEGISGQLEHTQDGPTREGELVVFGVRVVDSSPAVSLRLLGVDGAPVAKGSVSVLFEMGGVLMMSQEVASGDDGRLLVALPERLVGDGGRIAIWRRHEKFLADSIYGGAAVVAIAANPNGLRDLGDVQLVEEPVAVAGRLVDSDGKPLAGLVVRMSPTRAPDLGDGVSLRPRDVPQGRPLHHQATTDAEGRFTFRELEPAARAGPLEIDEAADGAWLLAAGTRLTTGSDEQRLVAMRPGRLQLSFATKPPRQLMVQVFPAAAATRVRNERVDEATGLVTVPRLAPGRYDLTIRVGRREMRIQGVEIRAGETCADPRLTGIDWTQGQGATTVRLRRADGLPSSWMQWRCLSADNRMITSGSEVRDGEVLVLPEGTRRIAFGSERYRTVVVDSPGETIDVAVVPRRRIRLALPAGLELPSGLGVHAVSPLAPDGRAAWSGNGTELLVDGDGACQVEIRSVTVERGLGVVLWSGSLEVPPTTDEPPTIVLPLDAAAIGELRKKLVVPQAK